jgi:hypothetical protein
MFNSVLRPRKSPRGQPMSGRKRHLVGKTIAACLGSASLMLTVGLTPADAFTRTHTGCPGQVTNARLFDPLAVDPRYVYRSPCYPTSAQTIRVTTRIWAKKNGFGSWEASNRVLDNSRVDLRYLAPNQYTVVPELRLGWHSNVYADAFVEWWVGSTRVGTTFIRYTHTSDYVCGTVGCRIYADPIVGAYLHRG